MLKKISFTYLFLFLLMLIYIAFFNRFQSDDYILAAQQLKLGVVESIIYTYMNWSGRYFSFLFVKNTPLLYHSYDWHPVLLPILSVFALTAGFFFVFRAYFGGSIKSALIKAVVCTSVYFMLSFSLSEHLYWNSASKIYFFPFIYFLFFLVFYKKWLQTNGYIPHFIMYLLTFMIIGSNEIIAAIHTAIVFLLVLENRNRKSLYGLMVYCFVLIMVSFLAPGNRVRGGDELMIFQKIKSGILLFGALNVISFVKGIIIIPFLHLFLWK